MHPDILAALQQLEKEKKTPTLALLRTRTHGAFPMPQLIAALKQYKANPTLTKTKTADPIPEAKKLNLQQQIDELKAQVESLQQEVKQLKQG